MKTFIFVFSLILLLSCSIKTAHKVKLPSLMKSENINNDVLEISTDISNIPTSTNNATYVDVSEKKAVQFEDIVKSYKYVPLETRTDALIGEITNLIVDEDYIFIFDRDNSSVFAFDTTGKFITQIGMRGKGPREYIRLWNIALDYVKKEVCLLDLDGRKMQFYTYGGEYLRTEPMYYLYTELVFADSLRYLNTELSYNRTAPSIDLYRLVISDSKKIPQYRGRKVSEEFRQEIHLAPRQSLLNTGSAVYYTEVFSDTVWQFQNGKMNASFILRYNQPKPTYSGYERILHKNEKYFNYNISITDKYAVFDIIKRGCYGYQIIYNRETRETLTPGGYLTRLGYPNITASLLSRSIQWSDGKSKFITVLEPTNIVMHVELAEPTVAKYKSMQKDYLLLKKVKIDDNPVLLFTEFK